MQKIKDMLFDVLYYIVWVKTWVLISIFLIGILCFWLSFQQKNTVDMFRNISKNEMISIAKGTVVDWYYHRGGSKSGTERLYMRLDDGKEYYMLNYVLEECKKYGITTFLKKGDTVTLNTFDSSGSYFPRVFAISINRVTYLTIEEGVILYANEAEAIAGGYYFMLILGCICALYTVIVIIIRKFLIV